MCLCYHRLLAGRIGLGHFTSAYRVHLLSARTVRGILAMPLAWRPTAMRSPCLSGRGAVRVRPFTSVSLVAPGTGDTTHCRAGFRSRTHWRLSQNSLSGPNCRYRGFPSSVITPIWSERPFAPSSSIFSEMINSAEAGGAMPSVVDAAAFRSETAESAPRPLKIARTSAAVGLAAGSGDRHRWRTVPTSALLAGA